MKYALFVALAAMGTVGRIGSLDSEECFVEGDVAGSELREDTSLVASDVDIVIRWSGFVKWVYLGEAGGCAPFLFLPKLCILLEGLACG